MEERKSVVTTVRRGNTIEVTIERNFGRRTPHKVFTQM